MWYLETKRLIIRELTEKDFDDLFSIYQDHGVREFIRHFHADREVERARFLAYIRTVYPFYGFGLWGLFAKDTGTLIGQAGIESQTVDREGYIMLSYLLDSSFWGQGYAQEACREILRYARDELEFDRIAAVIDKTNQRSIHVAKQLGLQFVKEISYQECDSLLYVTSQTQG